MQQSSFLSYPASNPALILPIQTALSTESAASVSLQDPNFNSNPQNYNKLESQKTFDYNIIAKMREQDRVLHELWSMIVHIFRSQPLPIPFPTLSVLSSRSSPPLQRPQISPAAFGLLFIGISIALMLFGCVTFFIGFILMPLVIMLVLLFYFVGFVSKLSEIGRSILFPYSDSLKVGPVWNYSS